MPDMGEHLINRGGSTWKWHTTCREPASETDGEATFTGSENYTIKITTTRMGATGQPRIMRLTMNSKWLGADRGAVKPVSPGP